jgi:hypothetical protein
LEYDEWMKMLRHAGVRDIVTEFDEWSKPEMFWKIRVDRDAKHWLLALTLAEQLRTFGRIYKLYGVRGIFKILYNELIFFRTVRAEKLGLLPIQGD